MTANIVTAEQVFDGLKADPTEHVQKFVVRLKKNDRAWNPTSTKRSLFGPAIVTYTRYPSHIEIRVDGS